MGGRVFGGLVLDGLVLSVGRVRAGVTQRGSSGLDAQENL